MPSLFLNHPEYDGCTLYRANWPWRYCRDEAKARGVTLEAGGMAMGGDIPDHHDAYYFGGAVDGTFLPLVYFLKRQGRRIVWDIEDNYFRVPKSHPEYEKIVERKILQTLSVYLDIADRVTVITPELAAWIEDHLPQTKGKTAVLPNLVDADAFRTIHLGDDGQPADRPPGPPRVMWAGSGSHARDVAMILPAIIELLQTTEARFIFVGNPSIFPPELMVMHPSRVLIIGPTAMRHYPEMLRTLAPDVGLCPIEHTEFAAGKSAIKWMEYTLAGAAVVASDFGPYKPVIANGKTGYLVENKPDAWAYAVKRALDNRTQLWSAAHAEVHAKHTWQSPARDLWLKFFCEFAGTPAAIGA